MGTQGWRGRHACELQSAWREALVHNDLGDIGPIYTAFHLFYAMVFEEILESSKDRMWFRQLYLKDD